jgi:ATP-binding cassette, subfamily B, bacterial
VKAHEFIVGLEKGYDTEVGEGGERLSTGQRQLVALARAVLRDPDILVMDEATSSIDTATERLVQEGVDEVLKGRISFVVAHRLSTIRRADVILVIEKGRIAEQGAHAELLARRGRYWELYTNQFAADRERELLHLDDAAEEATVAGLVGDEADGD